MPTLMEWEKRLKPFFDSHLRIIGEVPLSEVEVDELADLIKKFIAESPTFATATIRLSSNFPYVFMTFLAHFAMYNDQAGYWKTLQNRIGAPEDLHNEGWHRRFVRLARNHNLKTFTFEDTPNYYVATIRFHGGIPTYSLPDFFDRMVVPAVTQQGLREIPPEDALTYLLHHVIFVDKPVLDFLENSGDMGLAWFEACCKLVRHARQNHGEVLPSSEVPGLPYYIHAFFEQYNEGLQDQGFHWSRPFLKVNLYSEDSPVVLEIPEQIIPLQVAKQILNWNISWPGQEVPIVIPCQVYHRRSGEFTKAELLPISSPATQVTIAISSVDELESEGTELRRWTIPLLPPSDQAPTIAFRENLRQVPQARSLPAQTLFLLTPKKSSLEVDPPLEKLYTYPLFYGDWQDWKLEEWDLTNALSLLVHQDGNELGDVVPVARELAQPKLVDGHLFDYQEYPDQPLYTSECPSVSIPKALNGTMDQALTGWKLSLASRGQAAPMIDKEFNLLEYRNHFLFEGEQAKLPLQVLLGYDPAGIYDVTISGPRGLKSENRLRLWPKLLLQNYSKELPQPQISRGPVKFKIYLQQGAWMENQPGAEIVEINRDASAFEITAQPAMRRVLLELVTPTENGVEVRVPVSIPVVRLRWGLAEENSPDRLSWSQDVLQISKERFSQYASSALHVEMHGLAGMLDQLTCQLVEVDNEEHILQSTRFQRTGFTNDWLRVSLLQFIDTVREQKTQVRFELVYQKDWQSPKIRYALLEVSPQLVINDVRLTQVADCDWKLTWEEDLPLKRRRVMLNSAWQPWQPALEYKITDENRGEFTFTSALPPSRYEVYFYIKPPYEKALSSPPVNAPCALIDFCTPEDRLTELEEEQPGHDAQFRNLIESACILDSLDQTQARDDTVAKAATHLIHLEDVRTLVGSIKWMRTKDISSQYLSFFRKQMFHPKLVKALLGKCSAGDENLTEYVHMVTAGIYEESARLLLEKVDDPLVISTCVQALLDHENEGLPDLIISMINKGRLTVADAVDLLTKDPKNRLWSLEKISNLQQSTTSNELILTMLPICLAEAVSTELSWLQDAIMQAISVEKSSEQICRYLTILVESNNDEAWQVLLDQEKRERIKPQEFSEMLRLNPVKALPVLNQANEDGRYSEAIQNIEMEYPQLGGLLSTGILLQTPFGEAKIERIQLINGAIAQSAHLTDGNFILTMVGGSGRDLVKVTLNFETLTFEFNNAATIYQCTTCRSFAHTRQARVEEHHRQFHPGTNFGFQMLTGAIPFKLDDIKYTN